MATEEGEADEKAVLELTDCRGGGFRSWDSSGSGPHEEGRRATKCTRQCRYREISRLQAEHQSPHGPTHPPTHRGARGSASSSARRRPLGACSTGSPCGASGLLSGGLESSGLTGLCGGGLGATGPGDGGCRHGAWTLRGGGRRRGQLWGGEGAVRHAWLYETWRERQSMQ